MLIKIFSSAHFSVRQWLNDYTSNNVAKALRVIYGGSASAGNCAALIEQDNIDGFLDGGTKPSIAFFVEIQSAIKNSADKRFSLYTKTH